MTKLYESEKYMRYLYHHLKLTPEEIAEKLNTSSMTIRRWLRKHKLDDII